MAEIKKIPLDTAELLAVFQLERTVGNSPIVEDLITNLPEVEKATLQLLEEHRIELSQEGDFWNEEELKMQFLAFLFRYARLNEPGKIKMFYERNLKAVVNGYQLSVKCDCLLAKPRGIGNPQVPYFFLQEFKKQKQTEDAEAQMLTAMLIAKEKNADQKPVYGAYLQGRNWTFTALLDRHYGISRQYDASQPGDLRDIVGILRKIKLAALSHNE